MFERLPEDSLLNPRGLQLSSTGKFVTGNTELAAFLMASGHRLADTVANGTRAEFIFTDSAGRSVQESVADFAAGAPINSRNLLDSLRLAKSLAKDAVASQSKSLQSGEHSREHRSH